MHRDTAVKRDALILKSSHGHSCSILAPSCSRPGPDLLLCCPPSIIQEGRYHAPVDILGPSGCHNLVSEDKCAGCILLVDIQLPKKVNTYLVVSILYLDIKKKSKKSNKYN